MKWIKQNRWLIIILPIVAVISLAASFTRKPEIPVRSENVQRGTIMNTISTNGKIEPVDNFQAHAAAPAPVRKVLVKEGDAVRAGQLLVQLDDSDARTAAARAQAQLRAAEADLHAISKGGSQDEVLVNQANLIKARSELDAAQRNLTALKKLQETGSASAGEVQEAENRVKRAQAETSLLEQRQTQRFSNPEVEKVKAQAAEAHAAYEAAQDVLKNSNVRAPFAGTVYSLPVRAGGFVNTGDLLVQVADLKNMQVRAFVDEPEIGKLSSEQKVSVAWDAIPGRTWEGQITRIPTTVIARGTRNVGEIVCTVDNQDLKLLPNTNVSVMVTTAKQDNALLVSREAVSQDDGHRYVYVIRDGHLVRTKVETSIANLTRIEVTKGLTEDTPVALGAVNGQALADGAPVKVVPK